MDTRVTTLSSQGLQRYVELQGDAIETVTARFFAEHAAVYAGFGSRGRAACREDLSFHLEFLRPVLEFGLLAPMVDYLQWLTAVLETRGIPASHVELSLDWLADFFQTRMEAPEGAIVAAALFAAKAKLRERAAAMPAIDTALPGEWPECGSFEEALLAGDRRQAVAIVDACLDDGRGLVGAEMHVIQPALYRIGRKWQNNQVSVAQEHLATAIAQSVMALGLMKSQPEPANGRKVLLACVEGNHHAVGLQMVADSFQLSGWEVQYLGANVPTAALVQQVTEWAPHLVGLSIAFAHQLGEVRNAINLMREELGAARPPVIVGGLAINAFRTLADHLGAEGSSLDAISAVATGTGLTGASA